MIVKIKRSVGVEFLRTGMASEMEREEGLTEREKERVKEREKGLC